MDRLADSITLMRGYGAQLWLFVQDLSQLKAVYPRWQSFLANTSAAVSSARPITTPPTTSAMLSASTRSSSKPPTARGTPAGRSNPGPKPPAVASTVTAGHY